MEVTMVIVHVDGPSRAQINIVSTSALLTIASQSLSQSPGLCRHLEVYWANESEESKLHAVLCVQGSYLSICPADRYSLCSVHNVQSLYTRS